MRTTLHRQISLFQPSLHVEPKICAAMRDAAGQSGMSRDQIVDGINNLAESEGIKVTPGHAKILTLATLEKWLNPMEREYVPPIRALVIFCRVVGSHAPLDALVAPLGLTVIDDDQSRLLRMAEIDRQLEQLRKEKKHLKGMK